MGNDERTEHDTPQVAEPSTNDALRRAHERSIAARARVAEREAGRGTLRAGANVARSAARGADGIATGGGGGGAALHHRPFDLAAFEALVGGRLIAWTGGAALVLGLALLAGMAFSNGWFGPLARTGLATIITAGLTITALRVRHAMTSNALFAAALGSGFITVGMAGPVHELIPAALAALLALAVGAAGTAVAVRRRSQGIAALGILGGLASPMLFAGDVSAATALLVLAAAASAAGVLVWQQWSWLRAGLLLLALPQLALWALPWDLYATQPPPLGVLAVLACFGVVSAVAAIGYELRAKGYEPSPVSALILLVAAAAIAVIGWFACADAGQETLGHCWLLGLAVAHAVAGLALRRTAVHREVTLLLVGVGVVLADVAAASMLDGVALGLVWTAGAAGAALLARRFVNEDEQLLAVTGMAGHLVLALAHAFVAVSPQDLGAGTSVFGAFELALAGTTASVLARMISRSTLPAAVALGLDAVGIASLTFLTGVLLDGGPLIAALAAEAVALDLLGRRDSRDAGVAKPASFVLLGLAGVLAIVTVTPPTLLADGFPDPLGAALALGSLALAAVRIARHAAPDLRLGLYGGAALTTLGLASGLAVSAVGGGEEGSWR